MSVIVCVVLGMIMIGCDSDENGSLTGVNAPAGVLGNAIFGDAEGEDWGAYYEPGDAFVVVNIPFAAAVKISYTLSNGGSYAIFAQGDGPFKVEIGLVEPDGTIPTVDALWVEYLEDGEFSSLPEEAQAETASGGEAAKRRLVVIHYLRLVGGVLVPWWPVDALFVFSGPTQTMWVVTGGVVQVTVVSGPFPKPTDSDGDGIYDKDDPCPNDPTNSCGTAAGGQSLVVGKPGQSCDEACQAKGSVCNPDGFGPLTDKTTCQELLQDGGAQATSYNGSSSSLGCSGYASYALWYTATADASCSASTSSRIRACPCK
jgi:hypothetical protein